MHAEGNATFWSWNKRKIIALALLQLFFSLLWSSMVKALTNYESHLELACKQSQRLAANSCKYNLKLTHLVIIQKHELVAGIF